MERIADFMRSILGESGSSRLQFNLNRKEIVFGRYTVRPDARQLLRCGEVVGLTGKAFDLLLIFLESGGRILTRDDLYERLWGQRVVEEANLSQTVYLLRRALGPDGDGRTSVETVPRIGYRFVAPYREKIAEARPRHWAGLAVSGVVLCAVMLAITRLTAAQHPGVSIAARNADELGEYHLALRTPDHLSYALAYFKEAERAAPVDATAYAGEATAYALQAEFHPEGSPRRHALVSLALASSAVALHKDPDSSRALAVRGFIAYRFQDDVAEAARDLERALVSDPSDAEAHLWHGVLLMRQGDLVAATGEFQAAHRLAPTSEIYSRWLARAYAFQRKPEQAIAEALETLQIEPTDPVAMLMIAQAQEQRGDLRSALNTLRILLREDPFERPFVVPDVARLELRLGQTSSPLAARRIAILASSGRADPFEAALFYFTIGDKAAAMQMLRRTDSSTLAIQRHDPRLLTLIGAYEISARRSRWARSEGEPRSLLAWFASFHAYGWRKRANQLSQSV